MDLNGPSGGEGWAALQGLGDKNANIKPVGTIRNDDPRPQRNDPCPCGSSEKFKHCCQDKKSDRKLLKLAVAIGTLAFLVALIGFWVTILVSSMVKYFWMSSVLGNLP